MSTKGKSREELFNIWKMRTRVAKELHREKVLRWADKIIKEYAGENKLDMDTNEAYNQIAHVVQAVEERIQPHLFFQNPTFHAKAKFNKSAWEKQEDNWAAMVNHEYQDIRETGYGIELENELAILDARLIGYGGTKTTYEVEGDILTEKFDQSMLDRIKGTLTGTPPEQIETPVITKEKGQKTERFNPIEVLLDYQATHITRQRFVVHKMDVPKSDLEVPRYDQEKVAKIEPGIVLMPEEKRDHFNDMDRLKDDPDFKGVRIWEVHDLENRVIHTLADGVEDFIEFNAPYPLPTGCEFNFIWFMEKPNGVYPLPPVKTYRKRAGEFSYIHSKVAEQIDKFLPKIFVDKNRLDDPEKKKLQLGNLGTIIGVNGPTGDVASVFNPQVGGDFFKYLAMTKELLNMESGVSEYEISTPEKRKATEARLIDRGVRSQRLKPQKRVKGYLTNQSYTIFNMVKANAPFEHFEKVLGPEEAELMWNDPETGKKQWTDENAKGDFWFTYEVESVTPQDEEQRNQNDMEAIEMMRSPDINLILSQEKKPKRLNISPVLERIIKNRWKIRDISTVLEDLSIPTPEEEHDLWMQGEYPPISEDEAKNPEKLMEHFQKHSAWMNSPGFQSLPEEIKEGAISHIESYMPHLQKLQARSQQTSQSTSAPKPEQPTPRVEDQVAQQVA